MQAYFYQKNNQNFLAVKLSPKSSKDTIIGITYDQYENEYLAVKVRALPEKGKANIALIAFLSKLFAVPKTHMELVSGHTNSHKTIKIDGDFQTLQEKILSLISQ